MTNDTINNTTSVSNPKKFMQRWSAVQKELIPDIHSQVGVLTPKLEKLIHTLEWVRMEEFIADSWCGMGRPPHERAWLANAFVAKMVLGIQTTTGLLERLECDRPLRRICGFSLNKKLPSQATFSRAFEEFAQLNLLQRVHETMIKAHLGDALIGHISRDATAISARERPMFSSAKAKKIPVETLQQVPDAKPKRGRPRSGELRAPLKISPLTQQRQQTLEQILAELPTHCDRGTKCNAQGYKISWNGYKLHLDTADCGVPITALLSSASMHDSLAAIPLSLMSAKRVTNLYDVMDAAYCSAELREHSSSLGHVALIDHNPRRGQKIPFDPAQAVRYNERTAAERTNARLKDEFGANNVRVKGGLKVMCHLMFGVLCLTADQLMRLQG